MSKFSSKKNDELLGAPLLAGPKSLHVKRASWTRTGLEAPRLFLLCLLGLTVALVFWAAFARIDQVVRVEGKVIPAGRSQQIQHLEGGIVASINTVEGASVKRGDLLLTIDDTTAGTNLSEAQSKLNDARVRAIRLEAETQNKASLAIPHDLAGLPVTAAEQSLFAARHEKLNQEIAVHQNTIKQRQADIGEIEQRRIRLDGELATAQQRFEMTEGMAAHGAASKLEVLEAQSRVQRIKTEMGEAIDTLPKLKAAISEEQSRIEAGKAEFSSQAHNELVETLGDIDRLTQTITAAADRLKRTEIRAPIDGVINRISVNTVGGVVKPGEDLVELIPNTDAILVEARAQPRDRGYLRVGLDSEIRISAYDAGELGLLRGQVTEVSADSIADQRGDPYYQVNVLVRSVPPSYTGHVITPGMTVTADIVTGQRTVLAYLLSPLRKFTYNMFRDPR